MDRSPNSERHSRLGDGLIYFCVLGLAIGSIVKFLHPARVVAYMGFLGYQNSTLLLIAGLELMIATLFLLPSTRPAGLLLVSAYFGGAIASHLATHPLVSGGPFLEFNARHPYLGTLPATVFLASAWMGVWLREGRARTLSAKQRESL